MASLSSRRCLRLSKSNLLDKQVSQHPKKVLANFLSLMLLLQVECANSKSRLKNLAV